MSGDRRKKSLYLPEDVLREIDAEADRLDRSESYIIRLAWKFAREKVRALPKMEVV